MTDGHEKKPPEEEVVELARELQRYKNRILRYEGTRQDRAHYDCADSLGEARCLREEEHLCSDCLHVPVCSIAAAIERCEEFAPVMFRCGAYLSIEMTTEKKDESTPPD